MSDRDGIENEFKKSKKNMGKKLRPEKKSKS